MLNQFDNAEFNSKKVFNGSTMNVLTFYGMDDGLESSLGFSVGMLAVLIVVFSACGVFALATCQHSTR